MLHRSCFEQITYTLVNTPSTSSGFQDLSVTEFQNGSVIVVLSLEYSTTSSVSATDIDGALTSTASSDSLSDGTDSLDVETNSIMGKNVAVMNSSVGKQPKSTF